MRASQHIVWQQVAESIFKLNHKRASERMEKRK